MTFDHDFGYSFPLFSSLLKKGEKKRRKNKKIVIKTHAFQTGRRTSCSMAKTFFPNDKVYSYSFRIKSNFKDMDEKSAEINCG